MNAARSVSSEVEVAVDPKTAFSAFTEEMNLWWVRGPINFFDSARAVAKVCEPGVGGRILEVYDAATGEGLEVARITAWHPGELLASRSSVDYVEREGRFEPAAHWARARARGATIVTDIHQHGYRAYEADDLEGNRWTFAQARPTMR